MKLKNILIVVDNIEESIHFYNELFGLNVISRQEANVIMSEGLVLQDAGIWQESMQVQIIPYNNRTELDGGQKLVRFYDPSGNLIEIRTPWDKLGIESD